MKFLRQFGAACLAVGIVIGLGLAWDHLGPHSLPGENRLAGVQYNGPPPGGRSPLRGKLPHHLAGAKEVLRGPHGRLIIVSGGHGGSDLGLNSMFERVDWPFAERTIVIEGAIIVAVLMLDAGRRRWRRAKRRRRLRALAGEPMVQADRTRAG